MEKIKLFLNSEKGKDLLIVIIVIMVGLGSFMLGRLSNNGTSEDLKIAIGTENTNELSQAGVDNSTDVGRLDTSGCSSSATDSSGSSSGKPFFASKKGKKYYTVDCTTGKSIVQTNRIYFSTGEDAEAAGYSLSSSCT